jgi:transcriptional regulator GlxA family with amidase domain
MPHGWSFNDYDLDETGKIENITIIFPELLLNTLQKSFPEFKASIAALKQKKQSVSLEGNTLATVQELMKKMVQQNNIERLSSFFQLVSIVANSQDAYVVGSQYRKDKVAVKMQEINRYMVNNFQREISLEMVARHVAMNRSSFCSFFKREQGKSFFSALAEFRINCSCTMLVQTEMSIANICYAVGFNDVPHYNRTFKRQKGISPKSYRAQHSKVIN